jgi:hypothetical protein
MLVTFRVSAEEHEELTQSSLKSGARSIADFVREAALQKAEAFHFPGGNLGGDLLTLSGGLRELDAILGETREKIRNVLGPVRRESQHATHGGSTEQE